MNKFDTIGCLAVLIYLGLYILTTMAFGWLTSAVLVTVFGLNITMWQGVMIIVLTRFVVSIFK